MKTFEEIKTIVIGCNYLNWKFNVVRGLGADALPNPWVQLEWEAPCNVDSSETFLCKGRKWKLSVHMTESEIVQTCFTAVMAAVEHEAREVFKYRSVPVMWPHFDVQALLRVYKNGEISKREEPT